ncbi:MAG TPA: protein kinase [Polyangiaceae bacterium]|nr:protein kinase [Polyangiaceae bacterium]
MVLSETALGSAASLEDVTLEQPAGASGTRLKVAARPATVGATWMDLFHPGTPQPPGLDARVRVVADVAGALIQIHDNAGLPRPHRRHGRLTPRHLLIGVDGSASLFNAREPFSKLLPPQPDLGYLAPELLTQSGPATQQSDVFSLGVLLWEALDNGRLFPHRRAAAISRLIARRSLPMPRIEEEWAMPLGEVAMKALSLNPDDRYLDGTAFWLALREHLPAPDAARQGLSRLAQRALKLELTTDIRDNPPYLAQHVVGIGASLPPSRSSALGIDDEPDAPARYSLHPERSSRHSVPSPAANRSEDAAWALSDPPPPRVSQLGLGAPSSSASINPEPRVSRPPSVEPARSAPPPARASAPPVSSRVLASPSTPRSEPDSPISTLHVNLPRELVDASLPFYVSGQPASRPFPWGALSFAALIFFGVGAAVAFGAVTALRSPPAMTHESVHAAIEPSPAPAAVAPAVSPVAAVAPAPPVVAPVVAAAPAGTTPAAATSSATPEAAAIAAARENESNHKPAKRAKPAKPRRPKLDLAPVRQEAITAPVNEPSSEIIREDPMLEPPTPAPTEPATGEAKPPAPESLPFVEQPY